MLPGRSHVFSRDTSSSAEEIQVELLRRAPVWRRVRSTAEMSEAVMLLARAGAARRHPHDSPDELRRLTAEALLGNDLASRAYGR